MKINLKGTRKEQSHSMPLYCNLFISSTHSTFFPHLDNPISFFYLLMESCASILCRSFPWLPPFWKEGFE